MLTADMARDMSGKVCGQCSHYIGCGDWDLCCSQGRRRLCYEDTPADGCRKFDQTTVCDNRASCVGMFRCSICNHFGREEDVGDTCPGCGHAITGPMWSVQKHWDGGGR